MIIKWLILMMIVFVEQIKSILERKKETDRIAREKAKERSSKDDKERASRTIGGVNHLEIPAELAFFLSKLEGIYTDY